MIEIRLELDEPVHRGLSLKQGLQSGSKAEIAEHLGFCRPVAMRTKQQNHFNCENWHQLEEKCNFVQNLDLLFRHSLNLNSHAGLREENSLVQYQ